MTLTETQTQQQGDKQLDEAVMASMMKKEEARKIQTLETLGQDAVSFPSYEEEKKSKLKNPIHFNITSFLSDSDFDYLAETKHAAEEAIGWAVLPQNVVFRMDKLAPVQTKWGLRYIVDLRTSNGDELKAWCPSNVVRDIKTGLKLNGSDCHAYLKSLGQKETDVPGESKKKYFDFESVYICVS